MQLGGYFSGARLTAIVIAGAAAIAHGAVANARGADGAADEHAHHHMPSSAAGVPAPAAAPVPGANRTTADYVIPNVCPATLIRAAPSPPWTRLDGFAAADPMIAEISDLSQLHAAR